MITLLCIYLLVFHWSWSTGLIVFGLFILDHTILESVREALHTSRANHKASKAAAGYATNPQSN